MFLIELEQVDWDEIWNENLVPIDRLPAGVALGRVPVVVSVQARKVDHPAINGLREWNDFHAGLHGVPGGEEHAIPSQHSEIYSDVLAFSDASIIHRDLLHRVAAREAEVHVTIEALAYIEVVAKVTAARRRNRDFQPPETC
jgi:hypothetical protein